MVQQVVDLNPVEVPNRYEMPRFLPSGAFVRLLGVPILITYLLNEIPERINEILKKCMYLLSPAGMVFIRSLRILMKQ
jgi:hypothetical protein